MALDYAGSLKFSAIHTSPRGRETYQITYHQVNPERSNIHIEWRGMALALCWQPQPYTPHYAGGERFQLTFHQVNPERNNLQNGDHA